MIFLEPTIKIFFAIHGLVAMATLIALTIAWLGFFKRSASLKSVNLWSLIGAAGYIFTWLFGLLIYPVFRVRVRAEYFDPNLPWATGLFEIKEHLSSLGLFAALALLVIILMDFRGDKRIAGKNTSHAFLLYFVWLITVTTAVIGFILTSLKSL